jgi:hypothetical protein
MIVEHFNLPITNKKEIDIFCQRTIDNQFKHSTNDPFYLDESFFRNVFKEHFKKIDRDFKFVRGWFHFIKKGAYLRIHEHEPFTALYYLRLPEKSGQLYFDKEKSYQQSLSCVTPIQKRDYVKCQEDDFLIFGPNDSHGVTPHENEITRLTLGMEFTFTE